MAFINVSRLSYVIMCTDLKQKEIARALPA